MTTKVAIVTGGAQGIGRACCGVLRKEGYKVGIFDINESVGKQTADELSSQFGSGSCVFFKCDVTESGKLKACYNKVVEVLGKISCVVNVAGTVDEVNWKNMVDLNLKALIESTYIAVNQMRKDKGGNGGTIVNISSIAGLHASPGWTAYSAAKWGVIGFTQSMVASLALAKKDWGISMMVLCPWTTDTALLYGTAGGPLGNIIVSPAVPDMENRKTVLELIKNNGVVSLEEISDAFEKLLKDNKNGAVMSMSKKKGSSVKLFYVKQHWSKL